MANVQTHLNNNKIAHYIKITHCHLKKKSDPNYTIIHGPKHRKENQF